MNALKDILYIEDDPDIQAIAQMALESIGNYRVRLCHSGDQGLEEIKNNPPQLIMLDVMMPGLDGPSTFHAIRELPQGKKIPVIFITAKVQKREVDEYLNLGALGVISKPFDAMSLSQTVQNFWNDFQANVA